MWCKHLDNQSNDEVSLLILGSVEEKMLCLHLQI